MTHFRRYIPVVAVAIGVIILTGRAFRHSLDLLHDSNHYVCLLCLVVIGLCLLMGYAGQISLGHAGFFAIGGYTIAVLTTHNLMVYRDTALVSLCRSLGLVVQRQDIYGADIFGFFSMAGFYSCDSADCHNRFYDWLACHSP